jgi:hypothetical protein
MSRSQSGWSQGLTSEYQRIGQSTKKPPPLQEKKNQNVTFTLKQNKFIRDYRKRTRRLFVTINKELDASP